MKKEQISDQYYDWSDIQPRKGLDAYPAPAKKAPCRTPASLGVHPAGFADRALQTLRESGMQVRTRTRPWTDVLPLGQSIGFHPAHGLCPLRISAAGSRVCPKPTASSRPAQADLCDQSRTASTTRATIDNHRECDCHNPACRFCPRADGRHACRQHAPRLFPTSTTSRGASE